MKRRVNLIAGILHNPKVLFLDEPTVGVDVQSKNAILDYLKVLNQNGTTIIYTSHHLAEAEDFCDTIAILDQGRIYAQGTPSTLIASVEEARNLEEVFISLTGKDFRDAI
ncbi:Daunorubicin/doxorubicin resistance ATP-binding protein DrrA [compost metagenome]